jgi:antitoxin MazE
MKTALIPIGNSRGVRIPKPLIDQCGLRDEVEMDVQGNALLLRAVRESRAGWNETFALMARLGDDKLLDPGQSRSRWDDEEWEWK